MKDISRLQEQVHDVNRRLRDIEGRATGVAGEAQVLTPDQSFITNQQRRFPPWSPGAGFRPPQNKKPPEKKIEPRAEPQEPVEPPARTARRDVL